MFFSLFSPGLIIGIIIGFLIRHFDAAAQQKKLIQRLQQYEGSSPTPQPAAAAPATPSPATPQVVPVITPASPRPASPLPLFLIGSFLVLAAAFAYIGFNWDDTVFPQFKTIILVGVTLAFIAAGWRLVNHKTLHLAGLVYLNLGWALIIADGVAYATFGNQFLGSYDFTWLLTSIVFSIFGAWLYKFVAKPRAYLQFLLLGAASILLSFAACLDLGFTVTCALMLTYGFSLYLALPALNLPCCRITSNWQLITTNAIIMVCASAWFGIFEELEFYSTHKIDFIQDYPALLFALATTAFFLIRHWREKTNADWLASWGLGIYTTYLLAYLFNASPLIHIFIMMGWSFGLTLLHLLPNGFTAKRLQFGRNLSATTLVFAWMWIIREHSGSYLEIPFGYFCLTQLWLLIRLFINWRGTHWHLGNFLWLCFLLIAGIAQQPLTLAPWFTPAVINVIALTWFTIYHYYARHQQTVLLTTLGMAFFANWLMFTSVGINSTLAILLQLGLGLATIATSVFAIKLQSPEKRSFFGVGILALGWWWMAVTHAGWESWQLIVQPFAYYLVGWAAYHHYYRTKASEQQYLGAAGGLTLSAFACYWGGLNGDFPEIIGTLLAFLIGIGSVLLGNLWQQKSVRTAGIIITVVAVFIQTADIIFALPWYIWLAAFGGALLWLATSQLRRSKSK